MIKINKLEITLNKVPLCKFDYVLHTLLLVPSFLVNFLKYISLWLKVEVAIFAVGLATVSKAFHYVNRSYYFLPHISCSLAYGVKKS